MQIAESARKHGVSDDAMFHALRHAIRTIPGTNDVTLFIGGDHTGRLLEVGVKGLDTEDERIVHAMDLRPAFYKFL